VAGGFMGVATVPSLLKTDENYNSSVIRCHGAFRGGANPPPRNLEFRLESRR
jgi:hypothetical protein